MNIPAFTCHCWVWGGLRSRAKNTRTSNSPMVRLPPGLSSPISFLRSPLHPGLLHECPMDPDVSPPHSVWHPHLLRCPARNRLHRVTLPLLLAQAAGLGAAPWSWLFPSMSCPLSSPPGPLLSLRCHPSFQLPSSALAVLPVLASCSLTYLGKARSSPPARNPYLSLISFPTIPGVRWGWVSRQ